MWRRGDPNLLGGVVMIDHPMHPFFIQQGEIDHRGGHNHSKYALEKSRCSRALIMRDGEEK